MLGRKVEKTRLKSPYIPQLQARFAIRLSRILFNQQRVVQKSPHGTSNGGCAITAELVLDLIGFPPAIEEVQDCD